MKFNLLSIHFNTKEKLYGFSIGSIKTNNNNRSLLSIHRWRRKLSIDFLWIIIKRVETLQSHILPPNDPRSKLYNCRYNFKLKSLNEHKQVNHPKPFINFTLFKFKFIKDKEI